MFKKTWNFITSLVSPIIEGISKNLAIILILIGTALTLFGAWPAEQSQAGLDTALAKIGSAILGAGVFAVIMKSAQFTEVFQKHISDVFYDPRQVETREELKQRWLNITKFILRQTLPRTYDVATKAIHDEFLNSELEYHFENFEATYDLHITEDNNLLIKHNTSADIVLSPGYENIEVTQEILAEGDIKLTSLIVNNQSLSVGDYLKDSPDNPGVKQFKLPLHQFPTRQNGHGDKIVKVERTYTIVQDLSKEPYLLVNITRYVRGFTVKAKINKGMIFFKKTGVGPLGSTPSTIDGFGFQRWQLANTDELLLPGQSYIIIVTV